MNTKKVKWVTDGLIAIVTLAIFCYRFTTPPEVTDPIDPDIAKDILNTTMQIRIFDPYFQVVRQIAGLLS